MSDARFMATHRPFIGRRDRPSLPDVPFEFLMSPPSSENATAVSRLARQPFPICRRRGTVIESAAITSISTCITAVPRQWSRPIHALPSRRGRWTASLMTTSWRR